MKQLEKEAEMKEQRLLERKAKRDEDWKKIQQAYRSEISERFEWSEDVKKNNPEQFYEALGPFYPPEVIKAIVEGREEEVFKRPRHESESELSEIKELSEVEDETIKYIPPHLLQKQFPREKEVR